MKDHNSKQKHSSFKINNYSDRVFRGKQLQALKRKKDIDRKRFEKAKMLREYSKLCAKEGVVSDRVNMKNIITQDTSANVEASVAINTDENKERAKKKKNKKVKPNPFEKALEIANENKLKQEEKKQFFKNKDDEISQAQQNRKRKTKLLMLKTKSGQPIMKNRINMILEKLQVKK